MLEHGGNLRDARLRHGDGDWIDLSTGINPHPYPAPTLAPDAWHRLPEADPALLDAARQYYRAPHLLAVAGTQAAIQALPRLRAPLRVAVSAPSYAEHAHQWSRHGHAVSPVDYAHLPEAARDSDVLVVVNPNNPTGQTVQPAHLLAWRTQMAARGGWLVVDEAFGDTEAALSIAAHAGRAGLVVLHSVGKFFGLAGLRLGFVAAEPRLLAALDELLGPWTVSGPAQQVARAALLDLDWQRDMQARLAREGARMRALLARHGIEAGGTPLFHWWPQADAEDFHEHMARHKIWVRLFRDAGRGIRIGLPADDTQWARVERALHAWTHR